MPYRTDRDALRERVEELERELGRATDRIEAQQGEIRRLGERAQRAENRMRLRRIGRSLLGAGTGTVGGLAMVLPVAAVTGGNDGLVIFGAIVGALFGFLFGLGSEIRPGS